MRKHIAIVGCGQLGSRHLQAIAKLGGSLRIQVVEPSEANQRIGEARLAEVLPERHDIEVEWYENLDGLEQGSDLTIVSTTARGRAAILKALVEKGHKRFLVEKIVCQSETEYESILKVFGEKDVKGWVDCTRRYFPFYELIIPLLEKERTVIFNATGGNHGLGCNAIHLLDLFWRITGSSRQLQLNGDYLSPRLLPNPRGEDLIEFSGTLVAITKAETFASISFHPENSAPVLIGITSDHYRVSVNESDHHALLSRKESDWRWEEHPFETLYSSNLTNRIARSILEEDACDLPTVEDSYWLHKELFRVFNSHIKRLTGGVGNVCPIT